VGSLLVVEADPCCDGALGFFEVVKVMEPGTLLFQAAEEALDQAVLLRGVRGDELLCQAVIAAGATEPAALKDEAVIAPEYRGGALGAEGPEAEDAGILQGALGLPGSPPEGQLVADDGAVVAVNDGGQMGPAVLSHGDVGEVHGPALVTSGSPAHHAFDPRPGRPGALVDQPAFHFQNPVDAFPIHLEALRVSQDCPQPPVTIRWKGLNQETDALHKIVP
jgi:hypothetical protein